MAYNMLSTRDSVAALFLLSLTTLPTVVGCVTKPQNESLPTGAELRHRSDLRIRMPQPVKQQVKRIAVMHPTKSQQSCLSDQFGKRIGEHIEQTVFELRREVPALELVERNRIDTALQELKIQASGLVRDEDFLGIGRMVGADHLLIYELLCTPNEELGRIKKDGGLVRATVSAKIIDVQKGTVVYRDAIEQSVFLRTPPSGRYWIRPEEDLEWAARRATNGITISLSAAFSPSLADGIVLDREYKGPGARVLLVLIKSPAGNSGIQAGDLIARRDGVPIASNRDMAGPFNRKVVLTVLRDGIERDYLIEIEK